MAVSKPTCRVHVANRQEVVSMDRGRIRRIVMAIVGDAGVSDADISVALVDDREIAALHGRFLDDPTPTDVLSFVLDEGDGRLEGEVVASAETAAAVAEGYGATPEEELLRYVVHGVLHLVGYDDGTSAQRRRMRGLEDEYLKAE